MRLILFFAAGLFTCDALSGNSDGGNSVATVYSDNVTLSIDGGTDGMPGDGGSDGAPIKDTSKYRTNTFPLEQTVDGGTDTIFSSNSSVNFEISKVIQYVSLLDSCPRVNELSQEVAQLMEDKNGNISSGAQAEYQSKLEELATIGSPIAISTALLFQGPAKVVLSPLNINFGTVVIPYVLLHGHHYPTDYLGFNFDSVGGSAILVKLTLFGLCGSLEPIDSEPTEAEATIATKIALGKSFTTN